MFIRKTGRRPMTDSKVPEQHDGCLRFWEGLERFGDSIALVDGEHGGQWTYEELAAAIEEGRERLRASEKKLVFIATENDVGGLLCYLSALSCGHAVYLSGGQSSDLFGQDLIARYRPDIVIWKKTAEGKPVFGDYVEGGSLFGYCAAYGTFPTVAMNHQLALLLSTSGSTGSPKLVRLSAANVAAAAWQVSDALQLSSSDRAVTSLPFSFVYGLSVVHSHLRVGASLVVTNRSVADRAFWKTVERTATTSIAGVSWTFQTFRQMRLERVNLPCLRKLTHSGGRLDEDLRQWLVKTFAGRGVEMFFMYGQTEAAGRICVLPPSLATRKPASVGRPVQGGRIECREGGEIVYRGPNVMNGYSASREDLTRGDDMGGVLPTGDVGCLDADGCLQIVGRLSRFCKLYGLRINLDDVEFLLSKSMNVGVISDDKTIRVFVEGEPPAELDARTLLARQLGIPPQNVVVLGISCLPRTPSGKVNYEKLIELHHDQSNRAKANGGVRMRERD